jgi:hypothetical protein
MVETVTNVVFLVTFVDACSDTPTSINFSSITAVKISAM